MEITFFFISLEAPFKLLYKTFITVVYVKHFGAVKRNFNYKKPNLWLFNAPLPVFEFLCAQPEPSWDLQLIKAVRNWVELFNKQVLS